MDKIVRVVFLLTFGFAFAGVSVQNPLLDTPLRTEGSIGVYTCSTGQLTTDTNGNYICVSCPSGGTYNSSTGQCETGTTPTCPAGYTYNSMTGQCETAPNQAQCPSGGSWDGDKKLCVASVICPAGSVFNGSVCVYNVTPQVTVVKTGKSIESSKIDLTWRFDPFGKPFYFNRGSYSSNNLYYGVGSSFKNYFSFFMTEGGMFEATKPVNRAGFRFESPAYFKVRKVWCAKEFWGCAKWVTTDITVDLFRDNKEVYVYTVGRGYIHGNKVIWDGEYTTNIHVVFRVNKGKIGLKVWHDWKGGTVVTPMVNITTTSPVTIGGWGVYLDFDGKGHYRFRASCWDVSCTTGWQPLICPIDAEWDESKNACVKTTCPVGAYSNGQCVGNYFCPLGYEDAGGLCTAYPVCRAGYTYNPALGMCERCTGYGGGKIETCISWDRYNPAEECPPDGSVKVGSVCQLTPTYSCPSGYTFNGTKCVAPPVISEPAYQ